VSIDRRLLAISSLLVLLCQSATASAVEKAAFAVLPPAQVVHLESLCSRDGPGHVTSGWDPAFSQVRQAEARLPGFVAKNRRPERPLSEYYRQYLGVVIDGKKLIYVNLFPRSLVERREFPAASRDDWRSEFVNVCDGGDDFWGALFDLEKQLFFSPRFNGVA
jgi:hypothetical protein